MCLLHVSLKGSAQPPRRALTLRGVWARDCLALLLPQEDYHKLLTKYAEAENTIDQLRLGAKVPCQGGGGGAPGPPEDDTCPESLRGSTVSCLLRARRQRNSALLLLQPPSATLGFAISRIQSPLRLMKFDVLES